MICKRDTVFEVPTGINNLDNNNFTIYPNPVNTFITIRTPNLTDNDFFIVEDIQGRNLISGKLEDSKTQINPENLSPGIFFVRIKGKQQKTAKFNKD